MLLIEDLHGVDHRRPDPTGKCLNVSPVGNANATRAWIAAVEMSRTLGRLFSFLVQYKGFGRIRCGGIVLSLGWFLGLCVSLAYFPLRRFGVTSPGTA